MANTQNKPTRSDLISTFRGYSLSPLSGTVPSVLAYQLLRYIGDAQITAAFEASCDRMKGGG